MIKSRNRSVHIDEESMLDDMLRAKAESRCLGEAGTSYDFKNRAAGYSAFPSSGDHQGSLAVQ